MLWLAFTEGHMNMWLPCAVDSLFMPAMAPERME